MESISTVLNLDISSCAAGDPNQLFSGCLVSNSLSVLAKCKSILLELNSVSVLVNTGKCELSALYLAAACIYLIDLDISKSLIDHFDHGNFLAVNNDLAVSYFKCNRLGICITVRSISFCKCVCTVWYLDISELVAGNP